jgi:DnaJ-class molecular chaperone
MSKEKKCQKCTDSHCSYTVSTVPYQLCPKCGGDGIVMVQNWDGSITSISSGLQTCNLCGGEMIIPMHVMPIEYKIEHE